VAEHIQYVDLYPDWDRGMEKLLSAVARTAQSKEPPRLCA
jgi:hypothetical protein